MKLSYKYIAWIARKAQRDGEEYAQRAFNTKVQALQTKYDRFAYRSWKLECAAKSLIEQLRRRPLPLP